MSNPVGIMSISLFLSVVCLVYSLIMTYIVIDRDREFVEKFTNLKNHVNKQLSDMRRDIDNSNIITKRGVLDLIDAAIAELTKSDKKVSDVVNTAVDDYASNTAKAKKQKVISKKYTGGEKEVTTRSN